MTQPLVSVLIPCFNAERWIGETLDAVFAQSWKNIEIIVVNDGSSDRSADVIRSRARASLKLIEQGNCGQPAAFNRALREAQGELIQYLDADDLINPEKIERQALRIVEGEGLLATAEWARFWQTPGEARFEPDDTWRDLEPLDFMVSSWAQGLGMFMPALWLCRRDAVDRCGAWREELSLDNEAEYFTRLVLGSRRVLFCPGARVLYRSGLPGSVSGRKSEAALRSNYSVLDLCEAHVLAAEDSPRTRRALSMRWQRFAYLSYPYASQLSNAALARARKLHGDVLALEGGTRFKVMSSIVGWKLARRMQRWSGRH
jgi:glycosyltransferase involved in cell wall biosynthesis